MSRSSSENFSHCPRDTVESDRRTAKKNRRPKSYASTAPQYFVPSFSVRRRVLITPELKEFAKELKGLLPRNYRVFDPRKFGLTIIEQRKLVDRFRLADEHPEPAAMENVANRLAKEIKHSLIAVPRRLTMPTGRIDGFGDNGNKDTLGVIPNGWKGFTAHYADKGLDKQVLPMPVIIREADLCVGALTNAFGGSEQLQQGFSAVGFSRTPHISFARKEKGGPLSDSEIQSQSTTIDEIMPETFELFDPVIYLRLSPYQKSPIEISARSPRLSQYAELLD